MSEETKVVEVAQEAAMENLLPDHDAPIITMKKL